MPTPFNQDETIAYDKLASNIAIWSKIPFRGKAVTLHRYWYVIYQRVFGNLLYVIYFNTFESPD